MLSTAIYPALSKRPAALAAQVTTGELRERLGYTGVSIADALGSASGRAFGGPAKLAYAAASAGTDLVLFTDLGQATQAGEAPAQRIGVGSIDPRRVRGLGRASACPQAASLSASTSRNWPRSFRPRPSSSRTSFCFMFSRRLASRSGVGSSPLIP